MALAVRASVSALGCEDRCIPFTFRQPALHVVDLGGGSEPEVLVRLSSGGAHCCFIVHVFERSGDSYELTQHDFGNPSVSKTAQAAVMRYESMSGRAERI